jgi:uncharacterized phage-like protein YoqJ
VYQVNRVLVTGYKALELGIFSMKHPGINIIKKAIKKQLISLMDEGLEWIIVSGQWGVELWAAEATLELKETYEHLRLAVITPFLEQDENWNEEKKNYYRGIVQRADYVNSVTKSKYIGPWQFKEKNKFLLRNTDGMILMYDEEKEGSPKFIREQALVLAQSQAYPIVTITAFDLQSIADEEFHEGRW